ncbi:MAG TPA: PEP/pyruvate-binding domain-containing protein [Mycobacterium sp.]
MHGFPAAATCTTSPRVTKDQKDLLGGEGANLAEMTKLGLPVPPGFTITSEACREYLALGREPGCCGSR